MSDEKRKVLIRVFKNSKNLSDILLSFIEEDENVTLDETKEVDEQYTDYIVERTLNSRIRTKVQDQPGMTVLTEVDPSE